MGFAEQFVKIMDEANAEIPANKRAAMVIGGATIGLVGAAGTAMTVVRWSLKAYKATKTTAE